MASHLLSPFFPSSEHFHAKSAADSGDECNSCKKQNACHQSSIGALQIQEIL
jgi:hypothetical protein